MQNEFALQCVGKTNNTPSHNESIVHACLSHRQHCAGRAAWTISTIRGFPTSEKTAIDSAQTEEQEVISFGTS